LVSYFLENQKCVSPSCYLLAVSPHRWEEAEQTLLTSYALHRQTLPANCYHMQLMKATLGTFYRTIGRPLDAIQLLKDVTDNSGL